MLLGHKNVEGRDVGTELLLLGGEWRPDCPSAHGGGVGISARRYLRCS